MSAEKICPFMSRPEMLHTRDHFCNDKPDGKRFHKVYCQKKECRAWSDGRAEITEDGNGCRLIPL